MLMVLFLAFFRIFAPVFSCGRCTTGREEYYSVMVGEPNIYS